MSFKRFIIICFAVICVISSCCFISFLKFKNISSHTAETIVVYEEKNYRIERRDLMYYYYIYDNNGNLVKSEGPLPREPHIKIIGEQLLRVTTQAGTGRSTQGGYYYDISNDRFSQVFYSIFDETENLVAFGGYKGIVIRDIFDISKYCYTIYPLILTEPLSPVVEPIIDVEIINCGASIEIVYLSGDDFHEIREIIDLDQ